MSGLKTYQSCTHCPNQVGFHEVEISARMPKIQILLISVFFYCPLYNDEFFSWKTSRARLILCLENGTVNSAFQIY